MDVKALLEEIKDLNKEVKLIEEAAILWLEIGAQVATKSWDANQNAQDNLKRHPNDPEWQELAKRMHEAYTRASDPKSWQGHIEELRMRKAILLSTMAKLEKMIV